MNLGGQSEVSGASLEKNPVHGQNECGVIMRVRVVPKVRATNCKREFEVCQSCGVPRFVDFASTSGAGEC